MVLTFAGLFLLELVVGMTGTAEVLGTAIAAILALAVILEAWTFSSGKTARPR